MLVGGSKRTVLVSQISLTASLYTKFPTATGYSDDLHAVTLKFGSLRLQGLKQYKHKILQREDS